MKRGFDVLMSLAALVVLAPAGLVVALLVWAKLGRPIFFRQPRPGRHGEIFTLWKFRTMAAATADGPRSDAQRLGPFGCWLRATSLDELPELWNVLRGEMSLVGPRPLLVEYLPRYTREEARRHTVRPGLTGWAQVNGRNAITWDERLRLDLWYVDHATFGLDLWILARTGAHLVRPRGIHAPGSATMPEFRPDTDGAPPSNLAL